MKQANGFTLVELLVALLIFGMLSAAGVALLSFSVRGQEAVRGGLDHLAALRRTATLMSSDLSQAAPRLSRGEDGAVAAAFSGSGDGFAFVRRGWENPDGEARSSLQRVAYRLTDKGLERASYARTDGAAPAAAAVLLEGAANGTLRYRDGRGGWHEVWDPESPMELPRAVELVVEVEGRGAVRQLFLVGA